MENALLQASAVQLGGALAGKSNDDPCASCRNCDHGAGKNSICHIDWRSEAGDDDTLIIDGEPFDPASI